MAEKKAELSMTLPLLFENTKKKFTLAHSAD